jgi:hypothetical protein
MGSRSSFSRSSSIRLTFHCRRWSCQVPRENVKMGMKPRRSIAGLNQGSRFALYPDSEDPFPA